MAGAHSNGKTHLGVLGLLGGVFLGKTPVPKMKNGRNPPSIKKHTRGPGAFGRGSMGEISGSQMKNGRDLLYTKKKGKKGEKRGRELEKTLASSKILTHGLGSLKGSPQCEKKKKKHCAATIPLSGLGLQHHGNRSQSQSRLVQALRPLSGPSPAGEGGPGTHLRHFSRLRALETNNSI